MLGEPKVGCGGALMCDGRLLLVRRRRAPGAGCWSLPGGKVDVFEASERAAARELAEELGVEAEGLRLLCVVDLIDREGGTHWVSPVYLATAFSGEVRRLEPEKHAAFGWFALDALPEPLSRSVTAAAEALRRNG